MIDLLNRGEGRWELRLKRDRAGCGEVLPAALKRTIGADRCDPRHDNEIPGVLIQNRTEGWCLPGSVCIKWCLSANCSLMSSHQEQELARNRTTRLIHALRHCKMAIGHLSKRNAVAGVGEYFSQCCLVRFPNHYFWYNFQVSWGT